MVGVRRTVGVVIWVAALIITWLPGAFYLVDNQPEEHLQVVLRKENDGTEKKPQYVQRWRFERKADDNFKAKMTSLQRHLRLPHRPSVWHIVGLAVLLGAVGGCLIMVDLSHHEIDGLFNRIGIVVVVACLVEVIALANTTFQDATMLTPEHRAVSTLVGSFNGLWWSRVASVGACNMLLAFMLCAWCAIANDIYDSMCTAVKQMSERRAVWRKVHLCHQLRLDGEEPILWLRPNGAEWNTLEETWRLWPWPRRELARHEHCRLSWDEVYTLLADENHTVFVAELERQLTQRAREAKRTNLRPSRRLAQAIHRRVMDIMRKRLGEITEESVLVDGGKLLQDAVDHSLGQFRAMMSANIAGEVQAALDGIRDAILNSSDAIQAMNVTDRPIESTPLLPFGTRHCFRQNNISVVVIEQAPAVRRIVCTKSLMDWQRTRGTIVNDERQTIELSFPYVVFVVAYRHDSDTSGSICSLRVHYRNSPIGSLDDQLYRTNLTNTRDVGQVCMRLTPECFDVSMREAVEAVVNEFWTSCFNCDLSQNFEYTAAAEPRVKDFRTWSTWSATTPEDALRMAWLPSEMNLRQIINLAMSESGARPSTANLRQALGRLFTDTWGTECRQRIETYCAGIRTDGRYGQPLQQRLRAQLDHQRDQMLSVMDGVLTAQALDPALNTRRTLIDHVNEDELANLLAIVRELCHSIGPSMPGGYDKLLGTLQEAEEES